MRNIFLMAFAAMLFSCENPSPSVVQQPTPPPPAPKPARPPEPEWVRNGVLYECNIRQFSKEGNLAGVQKQLPRLKELGVDILWLMPIHPIGKERRKGTLGSPYSVQNYYAVNPDFGTADDLKNLVKEAHDLGLKVILDWVPNHTSWDADWKKSHPEYYSKYNGDFTVPLNEHGEPITDWSDVCDLDYARPATRRAMIEAMQYWLKTADLDGFRVDMAGLVPNEFWEEARPALDSVKQVFMLSEWQDEPGHFRSCFNANYGWKWKDVTKDIGQAKQTAQSLDTLLDYLNDVYPEYYYQMYFTQNHDENSHNGTESQLYGASADAFNVLMFTWQGIPMIYNGQEDGLNQRLNFYEKDPIRWRKFAKKEFYQKLSGLRHTNKALWSGENGGKLVKIPSDTDDFVYAFSREKEGDRVIVILNLSKQNRTATLNLDSDMAGAYANLFGASTMQVTKEMTLTLKPWEYLVLTNK
ncbi:MAG: alpha-glucosidase C-terminal domain-containing protein [Saprospiraceae bacterium]|nr:alpha-glucosidase C-terminal domain-containing protein [Saprospiraceae bacterium]